MMVCILSLQLGTRYSIYYVEVILKKWLFFIRLLIP